MADLVERLRASSPVFAARLWGNPELGMVTDEAADEIERLRRVIATCETQFRMLARLATAQRVTSEGKHVPKWKAVSLEASAGAEMCKESANG